jgi:hypothetical protein
LAAWGSSKSHIKFKIGIRAPQRDEFYKKKKKCIEIHALRHSEYRLLIFGYGNNPWLFEESLKTRNALYRQSVWSFNVTACGRPKYR